MYNVLNDDPAARTAELSDKVRHPIIDFGTKIILTSGCPSIQLAVREILFLPFSAHCISF